MNRAMRSRKALRRRKARAEFLTLAAMLAAMLAALPIVLFSALAFASVMAKDDSLFRASIALVFG